MLSRDELLEGVKPYLSMGKVVLLSGILIATVLFSAIVGMRLAVRGKVVGVPELVGMSVDDARRRVEDIGLDLTVTGERYDARMPAGTVLTQVPGQGVGIKANRKVQVIASLGRRTHPVPDLRGASLRAARLMARQRGYEVAHVSIVYDASIDEEQVVSQHPPPDSTASGGDQIDILLSRPQQTRYVMPRLVGDNLNSVLALLEENGFRAGRIEYRPTSSLARGTVLRQFPEAGYALKTGDAVHLEVAR